MFRRDTASFERRAAAIDPIRSKLFATSFERIIDELDRQGMFNFFHKDLGMHMMLTGSCDPRAEEIVNVITLCRLREECLRAAGFEDIFSSVKAEENNRALGLLPSVLQSIDACDAEKGYSVSRLRRTIIGVFAGNIFDLGAAASIELFEVRLFNGCVIVSP